MGCDRSCRCLTPPHRALDGCHDGVVTLAHRHQATLAAAAVCTSLLGCSGGSAQGSPSEVLTSAYEAVSEGDFTRACTYVDPEAKRALAFFAGTCESAFAREYPPDVRAGLGDVEIDEAQLDLSADIVVIPESAVTFDGQPSTDGDTTVVERDGMWWITG